MQTFFQNGVPARALLLLALALGLACSAPPASGPLPHEAYVWQRQWTPAVRAAVGESDLAGLVVLAAEVDLSRLPPRVTKAGYDPAALRGTGRPVGLAIRIGSFSRGGGRFRAEPGQIGFLTELPARW